MQRLILDEIWLDLKLKTKKNQNIITRPHIHLTLFLTSSH